MNSKRGRLISPDTELVHVRTVSGTPRPIPPFLPPWEDKPSECRDDEDEGGERGWKGALGNARSRRTRSEKWYNKRSGEREGGRYTVCLVCFFRLAQNARQAFTAVFSSGSTAPLLAPLLLLPVSFSLSLFLPCTSMQRSLLPSVARRERKNERACTSVDTFTWHF